MAEIEKMYENAGVEPVDYKLEPMRTLKFSVDDIGNTWTREQYMKEVPIYSPFTAEKQLELIKWLCQKTYRNYIHIRYERDINNWKIECNMVGIREFGNFDECFAGLINNLWQDLTDQEKEEIRGILNENS